MAAMSSLAPRALVLALLALAITAACRPATDSTAPGSSRRASRKPVVMVGLLEREAVQRELPDWVSDAEIDAEAAKQLATVPPGAEVLIYFGTWCSDSQREVSRLWKAFDAAGPLPFTVALHGVDEDRTVPPEIDLRYVPTIIVRRDGAEVGRIIESAPEGVERELLHLLQGTKQGAITARTDLGEAGR